MTECQAHSFKDSTHTLHLNFLLAPHFQTLLEYYLSELENTLDERLWTRKTTRNIYVYRDNRINTLYGIVTVINFAPGVGTLAHTQDPLRIRHLLPKQAQARTHFYRDSPRHDHQIGLARAGTKDLRAETREIILRSRSGGYHFDSAAGQTISQRPY